MNAILGGSERQFKWNRARHPQTQKHRSKRSGETPTRAWQRSSQKSAENQSAAGSQAPTDEDLVARVQAGDLRAFDVLATRHQCRIRQLAMTLMRNEHDAQEIAQEALLRAFLAIRGFRGASSFYTWLHRIVVNLAIDAKRQPLKQRIDWESLAERVNDPRAFELPQMKNADPQEVAQRAELRRQLTSALARLAPFHRTVIMMREVEGLSYQDMAEALRISKGTVMSRLFHARRRLQVCAAEFVMT